MPFVDLLKMYDPYIRTNNRAFFLCPADRGRGFNFEWVIRNGASAGITTNQLLFPNSYYYYFQFYNDDAGNGLALRKSQEVRYPTRKTISPCFASTPSSAFDIAKDTPSGGHGRKGMVLLFVDGHAQFANYLQLNAAPYRAVRGFAAALQKPVRLSPQGWVGESQRGEITKAKPKAWISGVARTSAVEVRGSSLAAGPKSEIADLFADVLESQSGDR